VTVAPTFSYIGPPSQGVHESGFLEFFQKSEFGINLFFRGIPGKNSTLVAVVGIANFGFMIHVWCLVSIFT
jgi:hypothetical protein